MPAHYLATTRHKATLWALAAGCCGLLLNHFLQIELYYQLSLLLGSLLPLVVLGLLGSRPGVLSGVVAALGTMLIWLSPIPFLALSLEIILVAILIRRGMRLTQAVMLYWLMLGMPLILLTYKFLLGLSTQAALVFALKFGLNGAFNAQIAALVIVGIRYYCFRKTKQQEYRISFVEALTLMVTAAVYIPPMIMLLVGLRGAQQQHLATLNKTMTQTTEATQTLMGDWLQRRLDSVNAVAKEVREPLDASPENRRLMLLIKQADPLLMRLGLSDHQGKELLHLTGDSFQETGKTTPSDNAAQVLEPLKNGMPYLGTVVSSEETLEAGKVVAAIGQPIIRAGRVVGVVTAQIPATGLQERCDFVVSRRNVQLSLIDSSGGALATSGSYTARSARPGLHTIHPQKQPGLPWLAVMTQANLVNRIPLNIVQHWDLVVEAPYRPGLEEINVRAIREMSMILALMLLVCMASRIATKGLSLTTFRLRQVTEHLPDQISRGIMPVWPPRTFLREIGDLSTNVKKMAESLGQTFFELKTVNEQLEKRIEARTKELADAKQVAEAASEAKSRFLAVMSHEIRTPMNGIMGINTLLKHSQLTPDQQKLLGYASDSADNLLTIINDILDFSKIEANKLELCQTVFSLVRLIESLCSMYQVVAVKKGLRLVCNFSNELPELVTGDQDRLRQVLTNLLNNAIKFTRQGEVRLTVQRVSSTSADGMLQISFQVTDSGIGIAPEKQERIFDMFSQADSSTTREFGGTGLGLAICKNLVGLMGGAIQVTSTPGVGSTFSFGLPFKPAAYPAKAEGKGNLIRHRMSPARILLAEDQAINRMILSRLLDDMGHKVVAVENGRRLLEELAQGGYDLVVTDISMPEMDGFEAVKAIRSRQLPGIDPLIPVLVLTAHALDEDRERCLGSGMDAYLPKPIEVEKLVTALQQLLPEHCSKGGGMTMNISNDVGLPQEPEPEEPLDREYHQKNYIDLGCGDVLLDVYQIYLESAPLKVKQLRNIIQAGDFEQIVSLSHGLKGESGSIGGHLIMAVAAAMEKAARAGDLEETSRLLPELEHQLQRVVAAINQELKT